MDDNRTEGTFSKRTWIVTVFYMQFVRHVEHHSLCENGQFWQRNRATHAPSTVIGDFKGVGHFAAKFYVEGLRFAPISIDH